MRNEKTTVSVQPGQTLRKSRFNGMENVMQEFQWNVQRGKIDSPLAPQRKGRQWYGSPVTWKYWEGRGNAIVCQGSHEPVVWVFGDLIRWKWHYRLNPLFPSSREHSGLVTKLLTLQSSSQHFAHLSQHANMLSSQGTPDFGVWMNPSLLY